MPDEKKNQSKVSHFPDTKTSQPHSLPMGTWGHTKLCKNRFGLESSKWVTRNGESRKWEGTLAEVGGGVAIGPWLQPPSPDTHSLALFAWKPFCSSSIGHLPNQESDIFSVASGYSPGLLTEAWLSYEQCLPWSPLPQKCRLSTTCMAGYSSIIMKPSSYRSMSSASTPLCLFFSSWCFQHIHFRLGHTHRLNGAPPKICLHTKLWNVTLQE